MLLIIEPTIAHNIYNSTVFINPLTYFAATAPSLQCQYAKIL